jgi:hypothetical protein
MRVFITGGTGLVGRRLARRLAERGDHPVVLSRQADRARLSTGLRGVEVLQGDPTIPGGWEQAVSGCDAIINLVGHNVFAQRWTPEVKRRIRDSRVYGTENVVAAMNKAAQKPKVLVQASAIGYYGPRGDEELSESSSPGSDFMAVLCREWEAASQAAESFGTRVAQVRIGVVLARGEGALGIMTPIFKYVPGGAAPVGSGDRSYLPGKGQQWMSWIHVEDLVGILLMALDRPEASGPINGTAPAPVRNADFSLELTHALRGWFFPRYVPFGPPDFMLRLILGEVAEVITKGQRVLPARAQSIGYRFSFPDLAGALRDLFPRREVQRANRPKAKPAVATARNEL